ncbi:MAG: hypothetical protein ACOVSR_07405 [Bacteroidia bacterium]
MKIIWITLKIKLSKLVQFGIKYIVISNSTLKSTQLTTNFNENGRFLTVLKHNDKYELWTNKEGEAVSFVNQIVFITPKKYLLTLWFLTIFMDMLQTKKC